MYQQLHRNTEDTTAVELADTTKDWLYPALTSVNMINTVKTLKVYPPFQAPSQAMLGPDPTPAWLQIGVQNVLHKTKLSHTNHPHHIPSMQL